ncbi:MAG: hypothetical protein J7L42_04700 [Elusimicrobia bacterium]|nr:hypothetical protein [Elusimicrobiota bacterium]
MKEDVEILIEGAGCSPKIARKVLKVFEGDLNRSFKFLASRHKNLVLYKVKFATKSTYSSGLLFFVFNAGQLRILRAAISISENPYVFAEDLNIPWADFENKVYSLRLKEEIIHDRTVLATHRMRNFLQNPHNSTFIKILAGFEIDRIREILHKLLNNILGEDVLFEFTRERISLLEFRGIDKSEKITATRLTNTENIIELDVEIVKPKKRFFFFLNPKTIEKIHKGSSIFVRIVDRREIARYLLKFIGVEENEAVPVEVLEIQKKTDHYLIKVQLGGGIKGVSKVLPKTPVEIFKA